MITTKEFDEKFDNGEDISEYLDFSRARRINQEPQGSTSTSLAGS